MDHIDDSNNKKWPLNSRNSLLKIENKINFSNSNNESVCFDETNFKIDLIDVIYNKFLFNNVTQYSLHFYIGDCLTKHKI